MDFTKYKNALPYTADTEVRKAYRREENRLVLSFFNDMAVELGYADHPKRTVLERLSWSNGHSSGYQSVFDWAVTLLELIE
jgi:hypothetical protein